jgi:calcium-translocating P-type ATPase
MLKDGLIYVKGAKEIILPRCNYYLNTSNKIVAINNKNVIEKKISNMAKNSGRIIVLAMGRNKNNLTLIGIVNIKDELRPEAKMGINLIKNAGINVIMMTGDAKETAISIANDVGLLNNKSIILTSDEFNKMDDSQIKEKINDISVIARAMPQDKSRLAKIIEDMGMIVGMTGDGVNDAPALKKANVGFAMGSGTEVAKEAADIVIMDNNILSISKAILYGRTVFKSIRKFIIYQLTVNMCALILSIVGSLIGITTPITIVQMLWLNMIMDTFAGIAFSFEPPLLEYMDESPKGRNTKIINKYMYSQIIWSGLYSALLCILFLKLPIFHRLIRNNDNVRYLMTAYFAMFIFMGIFNAFNSRTTRINIFANIRKNKVFVITFLFIFIVQIYIIYHGGELFRTYGLTIKEFIIVFIIALTVFPVDWLRKCILKRKKIKIEI